MWIISCSRICVALTLCSDPCYLSRFCESGGSLAASIIFVLLFTSDLPVLPVSFACPSSWRRCFAAAATRRGRVLPWFARVRRRRALEAWAEMVTALCVLDAESGSKECVWAQLHIAAAPFLAYKRHGTAVWVAAVPGVGRRQAAECTRRRKCTSSSRSKGSGARAKMRLTDLPQNGFV